MRSYLRRGHATDTRPHTIPRMLMVSPTAFDPLRRFSTSPHSTLCQMQKIQNFLPEAVISTLAGGSGAIFDLLFFGSWLFRDRITHFACSWRLFGVILQKLPIWLLRSMCCSGVFIDSFRMHIYIYYYIFRLFYHSVILLFYCSIILLVYHSITLLFCYSITLLLFYSSILLLFCNFILLF